MKEGFIVQHKDRIIRPENYKDLGSDLLVTSIFRTLQGEAPFSGWPAVFLRLAGCNFGNKDTMSACQFCDTYFNFDSGERYSPNALLEKLLATAKPGDMLVVTGGEPTLQHNLLDFLEIANQYFDVIQIETNGTQASFFQKLSYFEETNVIPISRRPGYSGVYTVVSPKGIYKAGVTPKPSNHTWRRAGCLNVVREAGEGPHNLVPEWAFEWRDKTGLPIYVSPMAIYNRPYAGEISSIWEEGLFDIEATSKNYSYAAKYAIDNSLRLSIQSHILTAIP